MCQELKHQYMHFGILERWNKGMKKLGCVGISEDTILRFFAVPVCVPTPTFQVKGAGGYNFFCFFMAIRTFNFFGAHLDKFFGHRALLALKLIHRHFLHPQMINSSYK